MKRNYFLAAMALLLGLFLYLFYRTDKTVVNEIAISLFSYETFSAWKNAVVTQLPLQEHIIYSLPEALWVFAITLTSEPFFIQLKNYRIKLIYLPLIFFIGLELLQLLHITNGRFDLWDIGLSAVSWLLAVYLFQQKNTRQNILQPFSVHGAVCISSYLLVWLAHVWE